MCPPQIHLDIQDSILLCPKERYHQKQLEHIIKKCRGSCSKSKSKDSILYNYVSGETKEREPWCKFSHLFGIGTFCHWHHSSTHLARAEGPLCGAVELLPKHMGQFWMVIPGKIMKHAKCPVKHQTEMFEANIYSWLRGKSDLWMLALTNISNWKLQPEHGHKSKCLLLYKGKAVTIHWFFAWILYHIPSSWLEIPSWSFISILTLPKSNVACSKITHF